MSPSVTDKPPQKFSTAVSGTGGRADAPPTHGPEQGCLPHRTTV